MIEFDTNSLPWRLYEFEWQHKNATHALVAVPAAVLSALAASLVAMFGSFSYAWSIPTYAFIVFSSIALLFFVFSCVFVFKFLTGPKWQKLPKLHALLEHKQVLLTHFSTYPDCNERADKEWESYMLERLSGAVRANATNNELRMEHFGNALICLIGMMFTMIPSTVVYLLLRPSAS